MTLLHQLRLAARGLGLDIRRWPTGSPGDLRVRLLAHHDINMVIDVGANEGQYGRDLRRFGYCGQIISFEPYAAAFEILKKRVKTDARWEAIQCAVGESNGTATLNVSDNSVSSSLLPMLQRHVQVAPDSQYVAAEIVEMVTLDAALESRLTQGHHVYLKIDAQGYAAPILSGAVKSMKDVIGLQVELSLVPLYDGERLFHEVQERLCAGGFKLMRIEPGFTDQKTGQMLQVDAIFYRQH